MPKSLFLAIEPLAFDRPFVEVEGYIHCTHCALARILRVRTGSIVVPFEQAVGQRDGELLAVLEATSGMYGDLQAIAGQSLKEIDALEGPTRLELKAE